MGRSCIRVAIITLLCFAFFLDSFEFEVHGFEHRVSNTVRSNSGLGGGRIWLSALVYTSR